MADTAPQSSPQQDPRVYFAAERTFLAWFRTGLGLMGVGFAVARFGLFLRELRPPTGVPPGPHSTSVSVWSGVALVLLGVLVNGSAVARHILLVRALSAGTWQPGVSRSAVALAILLVFSGLAMAVYLVVLR